MFRKGFGEKSVVFHLGVWFPFLKKGCYFHNTCGVQRGKLSSEKGCSIGGYPKSFREWGNGDLAVFWPPLCLGTDLSKFFGGSPHKFGGKKIWGGTPPKGGEWGSLLYFSLSPPPGGLKTGRRQRWGRHNNEGENHHLGSQGRRLHSGEETPCPPKLERLR